MIIKTNIISISITSLKLLLVHVILLSHSIAFAQIFQGTITLKGKPICNDEIIVEGEYFISTDCLGHFKVDLNDSVFQHLNAAKVFHLSIFINKNGYFNYLEYQSEFQYNGSELVTIDFNGRPKRHRRSRVICNFCFTPDMVIQTDYKTTRKISLLSVNDTVLSFDTKNNLTDISVITRLDSVVHNNLIEIIFSDSTTLRCTDDHPIYITDKGWCSLVGNPNLSISQLKANDFCTFFQLGRLDKKQIIEINRLQINSITYNITGLSNGDAYFANGVMVSTEKEFLVP